MDVGRERSHPSEVCRLRDIVSAAYEVYADTAEAQSVAVRMDMRDSIELPLERARMERVFLNLIDNALGAMPEGGSLEIAAETSDTTVVVKVQDTGSGIAPQILPLLFQPFVTGGKRTESAWAWRYRIKPFSTTAASSGRTLRSPWARVSLSSCLCSEKGDRRHLAHFSQMSSVPFFGSVRD